MSDINEMNAGPRWYVAHTYAGYENKVKTNIEKAIELAMNGKVDAVATTPINKESLKAGYAQIRLAARIAAKQKEISAELARRAKQRKK